MLRTSITSDGANASCPDGCPGVLQGRIRRFEFDLEESLMAVSFRSRWLTAAAGCSLAVAATAQAQVEDSAEEAAPRKKIASPLAVEPKTPEDLLKATLFTLQLDRPEVAREYLDAFLAGNPDDDLLLQLRDQFGTGAFLELSNVKALQPSSQTLLEMIRQAALKRIADPAVIDALIDKLSATPRERLPALNELKHLRSHAVPHLIRRATGEVAPISQDLAIETFVELGQDSVRPLIGALRSAPDNIRVMAAEALGRIGGKDAELALWFPAFASSSPVGLQDVAKRALARILFQDPARTSDVDPFAAGKKLMTLAQSQFFGKSTPDVALDGLVDEWLWDATTNQLVESRTTPAKAALFEAETNTRQAMELIDEPALEPLLAAILLTRDQEAIGWGARLPEGPGTAHDLVLSLGPDLAEDVLRLSLKNHRPASAMAALRILGEVGSRSLLAGSKGRASAIAEALNDPEPRVQFAAAEAVLQIDPETAFPQSTRVVEILARALATDDRPNSVVIDPNDQRGAAMGDYVNTIGFAPIFASTGQSGFQAAASRGSVALAIIHLNAIRWNLTQTIANLRADARTANIPIAIYGPAELEPRVRSLTEQYPRVEFVREPHNATDLTRSLSPFLAQVSPPPQTTDQRNEQRVAAVRWLRHIADGRRTKVFDLKPAEAALSDSVNDPQIGETAIVAMGAIPTPTSQERLLDVAVNETATPELRSAAARQLAFHIQRFGLLVSNSALDRLRLYASSETDPLAQSSLTAVMGTLKPDQKQIREQLLSYPATTAPIGPEPAAEAPAAETPTAE
jgi:hypothetical protein